jgi:hypothetical protein
MNKLYDQYAPTLPILKACSKQPYLHVPTYPSLTYTDIKEAIDKQEAMLCKLEADRKDIERARLVVAKHRKVSPPIKRED